MLFYLLSIFKTFMFIHLMKIEINKITLLGMTSLISILIISKILESKNKNRKNIVLFSYSLFSLILFADAMYFSQFGTLPSAALLKQAGYLTAVGESIRVLLNFKLILLILDIPILIALDKLFKVDIYKDFYLGMEVYFRRYVMWSLFGLLIVRTGLHGQLESIYNQEIYSYHTRDLYVQTIGNNRTEASKVFTQKELEELEERTKLKPGKYTGIGEGKNLIVIQMEALQNFIIDFRYEGVEVTPNLNKFIKENGSLYYDKYYQLVGRGNTSDAEFITNNSLHPPMEEPSYSKYEKNTFYGLPIILSKQEGYNSWAFHGYEKEFWNRKNAYVNQGFEKFISKDDYTSMEPIGFGLNDKEFFKQNIEYLKKLEKMKDPYYAFMITLTSHTPFNMPKKYEVIDILPEHKGTVFGNYINSIHYADKYFGKFINDLKKEGLYKDTVIALYGDHFALYAGEESNNKIYSDYMGVDYNFDLMMNIPLIIHVPGEEFNEKVSKVGSQKDFLPTILNIMGYENKKGLMFGHDLNNYEDGIIVNPQNYIRKGSFIYEDYMFLLTGDVVFQNGSTLDLKTRERIETPDWVRDVYDEGIREINMCDYLLSNDLLGDYIKNDGKINFTSHSDDGYKIKNIYYPNGQKLKDIETAYKKGEKVIALELGIDRKDRIIIKNSDININELYSYMEERPSLRVMFYDDDKDETSLIRVGKEYPGMKGKAFVEMKSFSNYLFITYDEFSKEEGITDLILNTAKYDLKKEDILNFINMHKISGIVMDKTDLNEAFVSELQEHGIKIYIEDKGLINKFRNRKYVDGYVKNLKK